MTLIDDTYAALHNKLGRRLLSLGAKTESARHHGEKYLDDLKSKLISSQRFIVSDDAVSSAIELFLEYPEVILKQLSRSVPLFETMWMEWSHKAVVETLGLKFQDDASRQSGVLITHEQSANGSYYRFKIIVSTQQEKIGDVPITIPIEYVFCPDQQVEFVVPYLLEDRSTISRITEYPKDVIDACLIGSINKGTLKDVDMEKANVMAKFQMFGSTLLSKEWQTKSSDSLAIQHGYDAAVKESVIEFAGIWRTIVALLFLLNDREIVSRETYRNPARRRFVGVNSVPYLQVVKVGLNLPRKLVIHKHSGLPPEREYPKPVVMVEQHWAERRQIKKECLSVYVYGVHEDERIDDRSYQCVHCGRKRWRVTEHTRGDARIGFVQKIRVVKTRKD